ncbi:TetR/AcrR family transcriptional regulator [Hydrogenophaga sp.]|jgi:TetR/AcrR family transcriptional repressor of nem operon|uniref:TetR/AcrR family transcriptional regulator n=1 Tax=Hydrogenophaga sp. TaxID=1904254 RepID=UPI003F714E3B
MEIAPNRKAQTHERILDTAARVIRRTGFNGVGVADIMKEAGLTHGGFYAHFASRDALLAEALAHAGRQSAERIAKGNATREARGASPFRALVEGYLSDRHLSGTENGCAVAALASEMPRQSPEVRAAAAQRVRSLIKLVEGALPAGTEAARAPAIASQMVGALQLARALGDNTEGKALLATNRNALLALFDTPSDH